MNNSQIAQLYLNGVQQVTLCPAIGDDLRLHRRVVFNKNLEDILGNLSSMRNRANAGSYKIAREYPLYLYLYSHANFLEVLFPPGVEMHVTISKLMINDAGVDLKGKYESSSGQFMAELGAEPDLHGHLVQLQYWTPVNGDLIDVEIKFNEK